MFHVNNARAANVVMVAVAFFALLFTSANAGVSDKEQAVGNCIIRSLNAHGWTPVGSFVPWGEHTKIKFTYPNKDGFRTKQTIYIYSVRSQNASDVLVFGMLLQSHDDSDFEIARTVERECHVPFSAMMT